MGPVVLGELGNRKTDSVCRCCCFAGELTAHCVGPNKVAFCELFDHRDGTFTLSVKPQEHGRHTLNIKYGGAYREYDESKVEMEVTVQR